MSENRTLNGVFNRIIQFQEDTHFLIYVGTGLYQISGGMLFNLLVSFLVGLPIIMAYPYLNATILWIIKLIGWIYMIIGIITILLPFLKKRYDNNTLIRIITIISIIVSILMLPIGPFLALGLKQEVNKTEKVDNKVKSLQIHYFFLLLFSGIVHSLIGLLFVLIIPALLKGQILLLYPYINFQIINLISFYGYINLIPGLLLFLCAFTSIQFGKAESMDTQTSILKLFRLIIVFSSLILLLSFPFGSFFGLLILQEFYSLKKIKE